MAAPRCSPAADGQVLFWCPGCESAHLIVQGDNGWTWNESLEAPTFTPSVLLHSHPTILADGTRGDTPRCHSYVTDGRIQFLGDSTHPLTGQTVDLPPWPDGSAPGTAC